MNHTRKLAAFAAAAVPGAAAQANQGSVPSGIAALDHVFVICESRESS